ncbi:MAG: sugar phosphate isomerase/epimerase [Phycisphaerales bacterium]|nr:sugar phosphate isomerase/epimerase [Phycisphaerales bacterium]
MRIGFSSLVCPNWDLNTIVAQAAALGFEGVELRGLNGEYHLPSAAALAGNVDHTRKLFEEAKVELVCLSPSASLDAKKKDKIADARKGVIEHLELASRLGCRFVKIFAGEVQRWDNREAALSRIARELHALAPTVVKHGVTLLVENSGDLTRSDDLWYLIDAVSHPSIQGCWNQVNAMTRKEAATVSIPRLGVKIGMLHVGDADYDADGLLQSYKLPGQGQTQVARQIELLKGLIHNGYLIFEQPKAWIPSLPEPEVALPAAATFLKAQLAAKQAVLSAYKGDKNPAKFAAQRPAATLRS